MELSHYERYGRKWYEKNKTKNLERGRKWQQNNRKHTVEIVQAYVARNKIKVAEYNRSFSQRLEGKYRLIVYRHKKREWSEPIITLEEFGAITGKQCVYCGFQGNVGIDRVDNSRGYTKNNCVSCCELCNHMKWNLTQEQFLSHAKTIANHYI